MYSTLFGRFLFRYRKTHVVRSNVIEKAKQSSPTVATSISSEIPIKRLLVRCCLQSSSFVYLKCLVFTWRILVQVLGTVNFP